MSNIRERLLGNSDYSSSSIRDRLGINKENNYNSYDYLKIYNKDLKDYKNKSKILQDFASSNNVETGVIGGNLYSSKSPFSDDIEVQAGTTKNNIFEVKDFDYNARKNRADLINLKDTGEYKTLQNNAEKSFNKKNISKYNYDVQKINEDDVTLYDKTIGILPRAVGSMFDMGGKKLIDEDGTIRYVPSINQLKQNKVSESYDTKIGKFLGDVAYQGTKIGTSALINAAVPGMGTGLYFGDMYLDSKNSALQEGYDEKSAILYAASNVGLEYLTGKLLGSATKKLTGGKSSELSKSLSNVTNKLIKNPKIASIIGNAGSEGVEEFAQEYIDNISKLAILDRSTNIKDYTDTIFSGEVLEDALYSAAIGTVTGATMQGISNTEGKIAENNTKLFELYKTQLQESRNNTTDSTKIENIDKAITIVDEYLKRPFSTEMNNETTENIETLLNEKKTLSTEPNNDVLPTANNYQYTETDNQKINDLRKSATKYNLNNSSKTKSLLDVAEKLIADKNYNIVFDGSIKSSAGNNVNAQITKNGNETIIKINPNSERAGEFLLVHEITHAIETDTMKQLVMDYASKNADFNNSLDSLKKTYGTEDVSDEVLADISGQLFGNQEFINSLSTSNPNIFVRIYYKIVSLANKITGNSQYSLFVKDLENKWRTAYTNNVNNILANNTKYMMTGLKGTKNAIKTDANNKFLMEAHNKAQSLKNEGKSNELIRQKTGWFQDKKGNWKFEIGDADAKIISKLEKNRTYTLKEVLKHDDLYEMYPELRELKVKFAEMDNPGGYRNSEKTILINNNKLDSDNYNSVKGTIIHEIQHAIQRIEKFPHGTSSIFGMKRYAKNLGEIEASDTRNRMNMEYSERLANEPETSKENPKHPYEKQLLNKMGKVEKKLDKVYNLFRGDSNEIYEENNGENKGNNLQINDSMGRISRGRGLEKYVQENNSISSQNLSEDIYSRGMLGRDAKGQELDNSSFSLKQKQLDIILENNPVYDDYHTWIRNVDDIKTFEETLEDNDYKEYYEAGEDFDETYSADMAREAAETGKITVYSSYPIEQGIFVSPSRMEAESYSGSGKVYSKEVNLTDIAWIDPTQGQYAKVNNNKYSQENNKWQEHLENNYKATGTRTILKGNRILNPVEISKLTKEDANTTPKLPNVKVKTGDGESKFYSNVTKKSKMLPDNVRELLTTEEDIQYYETVTNEESLEKALDRLNNGGQAETFRWLEQKSSNATATDVAEGWILLKQYSDAKDYDSIVQVAKKMREIGTQAGQTVQAFNILSRLTPEGMVKYAQSELSEAYNRMVKNKTSDWIEKHNADFDLKPEEVQFIMDTMQEVSTMEDGYDKKVKLAEIQKLMTDKLPPERGAGIKSWMRISMLFNPKTQVRNIMGNVVITPVNYFSDLVSSAVDSAIYKKTGVRTTGRTNLKSYGKGFKSGLYQSYNDFKKGINTRNIEGNRFEIKEGRSFNNNTIIGKRLNQVDKLLSFMLDAGDRGFYEASFTNSINNQMVLNKTNEVTQEMIDIATQEALSRTWQDNNDYTRFVLNIRKGLNKILNVKGYGLGDVLIPFAKTPANLTKAIVDYSPLGMVSTINQGIKLKRSLTNGQYTPQMQHQFVQNLGKATAGTMLYILGIALANAGITSGESDEDKDTANFMKNTLGINSYTIKIGNKSFSYDWAQPIAAPLAITANIAKKKKEEVSLYENIISSLDTAGNILLEQSFLDSLNTILSNNDGVVTGIEEAVMELPSRAIPTLMKQIVDLTDDTARTTFEYEKPLKTAVNKVVAKIPGLSKKLEPTTDTMGREILRYGGKNNIFNVFLNPANVSTENISESAKEIYNIYKSTGDKTIFPRVAPYHYTNGDGEKFILSGTEKTQFQKISGTIIENNVKMLENNKHYNSLSDIDKAEVIKGIVDYAFNKAKKDILDIEMSDEYNKVNEWLDNGGTVYDYYANKEENNYSLENSKKYNTLTSAGIDYYDFSDYQKYISDLKDMYPGEENKNKRKNEIWKYIQNLNLTKAQKILIYNTCGGYGISNYKNYMHNYINNLNVSKKEKEEMWDYLYG